MLILLENNRAIEREDARGRVETEEVTAAFVEGVTVKPVATTISPGTEVVQSIPTPDPVVLPAVNTVQKI
jgi:hypothetical protein